MKLCIIISNPEMGGAQRVSMNLAEWLQNSRKCDVELISLSNREKDAYDMNNYKYHCLKTKSKVYELRKLLKTLRPNVVLTMGVPLCLYTIPATIGLKLKHIVSERNDPAHFAGKKSTAIVSRFLMNLADGYVFQTEGAKDFYGGRIARKSIVIPNTLYNLEKMPAIIFEGNRDKTIVTVGRLNPQKNQSLLIRAFAMISDKIPEYNLIIWGEGSERMNLQKLINNLKLERRIQMPGTTNNVFEKTYKSSLFVLSSNFEGMPNALIEAMAMGLPVISTDCPCGGPAFLIKNNVNGCLVPINDEKKLSETMFELLTNESKARSFGQEAFLIRDTLSSQNVNTQWYNYLESFEK